MDWIDIKEQTPEPGQTYIVAIKSGRVLALNYAQNEYAKTDLGKAPRWEWLFGRVFHGEVVHWMPLPPPPK